MRPRGCRLNPVTTPNTAAAIRRVAGTAVAARPPTRNGLGLQQDGISVHRPSRIRQCIRLRALRRRPAGRSQTACARAPDRGYGTRTRRRHGTQLCDRTNCGPGHAGTRSADGGNARSLPRPAAVPGVRLQRDRRVCGATKRIRHRVPLRFSAPTAGAGPAAGCPDAGRLGRRHHRRHRGRRQGEQRHLLAAASSDNRWRDAARDCRTGASPS